MRAVDQHHAYRCRRHHHFCRRRGCCSCSHRLCAFSYIKINLNGVLVPLPCLYARKHISIHFFCTYLMYILHFNQPFIHLSIHWMCVCALMYTIYIHLFLRFFRLIHFSLYTHRVSHAKRFKMIEQIEFAFYHIK